MIAVSVCQAASLYKNSQSDWGPVCLVWRLWGPRNTVLDGGPDPPWQGEQENFARYEPPRTFGMAEARDFKFCAHAEG